MADDDAGPRDQQLPETTDPFVLLGVARDADERTLRAAYAALTRRYRPEQAPEQFARIHDAFARAREMQQFARAADEHRASAAEAGRVDGPAADGVSPRSAAAADAHAVLPTGVARGVEPRGADDATARDRAEPRTGDATAPAHVEPHDGERADDSTAPAARGVEPGDDRSADATARADGPPDDDRADDSTAPAARGVEPRAGGVAPLGDDRSADATAPTARGAEPRAGGAARGVAPLDDDRADELLAKAAAAPEPAARDALVAELLAANAFAPAVRRAPHLRDAVLGSAAIAWTALAEVRDRFAAIALWRGAWDRAYLGGELDRAQAMLEDVRLVIDAAEDLELARAALDRVVALAWKRAVTDELVDTLRAAAEAHYESVPYLARFDRELALATKVAARPLPPELSVLPGFLVAGRLRDFEHRKKFALDLRARLGADPAAAVVAIGAYRKLEPHVTRAMVEVVGAYLPDMRTRLDHLPRARFESLTRGLVAAGATPRRWLPLATTTAAVIAAAFVAGVPGVAAVGAAALLSALLNERRRYRDHIRPPLARLLHAVPVRVDVVAQWIRANPRLSGRLGWYDITIENDPDLDLFSLLAAASAEEAHVIEREVYET
ncbi:MAG: hypothetical protein KF773_37020 [Deltaproteobacteria bacterium]|nr:hypothetical protein [Deltaproteobacteria bacterium]